MDRPWDGDGENIKVTLALFAIDVGCIEVGFILL